MVGGVLYGCGCVPSSSGREVERRNCTCRKWVLDRPRCASADYSSPSVLNITSPRKKGKGRNRPLQLFHHGWFSQLCLCTAAAEQLNRHLAAAMPPPPTGRRTRSTRRLVAAAGAARAVDPAAGWSDRSVLAGACAAERWVGLALARRRGASMASASKTRGGGRIGCVCVRHSLGGGNGSATHAGRVNPAWRHHTAALWLAPWIREPRQGPPLFEACHREPRRGHPTESGVEWGSARAETSESASRRVASGRASRDRDGGHGKHKKIKVRQCKGLVLATPA